VVCTADLRDIQAIQAQIDGYRAVFAHLVSTERFHGGFRWIFRTAPGLEAQLRVLAEDEHRCCRFFRFAVRIDGASIVWETNADEHARAVTEEFARLPETLRGEPRAGHDVAALKSRTSAAGLAFDANRE
jgi:hypothetical protein